MRGLKKKYNKLSLRNTAHYQLENKYLAKYGLRSKKELGRGRLYLEKARAVYFQKESRPTDYQNHLQKNIKIGFIEQGGDLLDLNLDSYFSRTLSFILARRENLSIRQARKKITSGLVFYNNTRNRAPRTIIPLDKEQSILLK